MVVQVTTFQDGIFLNILQASSMLPHFAYMSTMLLHIKTIESHAGSMVYLWTHLLSSSATMLAHAFNTPTKVIESSHTPPCCICHNNSNVFYFHPHFTCPKYHDYCNPNLGLVTKAKAWKDVVQECNPRGTFALLGMWRNEPTHSQVDSHFGSWNPYGIPNFQKNISRVKTHWIKKFNYIIRNI